MANPPLPADEVPRLAALRALNILDTPGEEALDRFTRLAARLFGAPVALISLIDQSRQWFKSRHGLDLAETPRETAFCAYTILDRTALVVPDATRDERFAANPLVRGEPGIRFYAGAPLRTAEGHNIGSLCVIDYRPRPALSPDEEETLRELALAAMNEIELRRAAAELKRAEQALRYSEARDLAVLNNVMDGIVTIDASGTILAVNPAVERLFGFGAAELVGRNVSILMPEPYRSEHDGYLAEHIATGRSRIIGIGREVQGQRKDGTVFPVELAVSAVALGEQRLFVGTLHDMSERKTAEIRLRHAMEEAERANRAKSDFLSSMSHELRTPLNAILGFAQILGASTRFPLAEKQKVQVGEILKAGEHLLELIDEILDLARIEAGKLALAPEPIDVHELVQECVTVVTGIAERAGMTLVIPPRRVPGLFVHADHLRLKQVLLNILSNAVKYNRPGEPVTLSVGRTDQDAIRISVTDKGHGIPKESEHELFQPFSRLGAEMTEVEGTGLGLAFSKRLIEAMGGAIGVSSAARVGTTFWIDIPATGSSASSAAKPPGTPAPEAAAGTSAKLWRLLYVEDHPSNVRLVSQFVDHYGNFSLLTAPSAERGLEIVQRERPDIIMLDVNLPGMSGIEAVQRLKGDPSTRAVPVIAISANANPEAIRAAIAAGFDDYVTKPVRMAELTRALQRAMEVCRRASR